MPQDPKLDHISVCICTFKRPEMLAKALNGVISQGTDDKFTFEVVVVDNDKNRSAEAVVQKFKRNNLIKIIYDCEPRQNIALAINKAILRASGNFLAFIDDDESPVKEWLVRLYNTLKEYKSDGALGPVIPFYPPGTPKWLKKGNIFDRRRFKTGTQLSVRDTRTGNVLLEGSILPKEELCFNPAFGLTGGEDVEFFSRQIKSGRVFVWLR